MIKNKLGVWATLAILSAPPVFAQAVSFAQATQDYAHGKYAQALSEFETYRTAYPSNIQVHYYEALCYQALGRLGKAREEYDYVAKNDTGRLKGLAQQALSQLAKAGGSSGSSSGSSSSSLNSTPQLASATTSARSGDKVRKVIEFYADW